MGWESNVNANNNDPMGATASLDIRIYGNNARSTSGTWTLDNVEVHGTMTAIPEPASSGFFALGVILLLHARRQRKKFSKKEEESATPNDLLLAPPLA